MHSTISAADIKYSMHIFSSLHRDISFESHDILYHIKEKVLIGKNINRKYRQ